MSEFLFGSVVQWQRPSRKDENTFSLDLRHKEL